MDALGRFDPLLAACAALAVLAFVARKVVAGLFRAIGGDLRGSVKRRRARQYRAGLHCTEALELANTIPSCCAGPTRTRTRR